MLIQDLMATGLAVWFKHLFADGWDLIWDRINGLRWSLSSSFSFLVDDQRLCWCLTCVSTHYSTSLRAPPECGGDSYMSSTTALWWSETHIGPQRCRTPRWPSSCRSSKLAREGGVLVVSDPRGPSPCFLWVRWWWRKVARVVGGLGLVSDAMTESHDP